MTSYTNKLYYIAPHAARQIRRRELHNFRYGGSARNITLATYTLPEDDRGCAPMGAQPCNQFGQRSEQPALLPFFVKRQGMPAHVLHAADAFAARREYADHYGVPVTQVTAVQRTGKLPERNYRRGNSEA